MADPTSPNQNIRKAVDATRADVEREADGKAPVRITPPAPADPKSVPPEMVDACFHQEEYGDARVIVELFRGKYLRDNGSPDKRGESKDIYKHVGTHWQLDSELNFEKDLAAVGQVYKIRADEFYAEYAVAQEAVMAAEAREADKAETAELRAKALAIKAKAGKYMARAKKLWAKRRAWNTADLAFCGQGSLGFSGEKWNRHPTWLPFLNGTLDMATGRFFDSKPEHYFNFLVPWEWRGLDEPCPRWLDTINKALGFDPVLIDYFQQAVGIAATGFQTKDLFVAFGPRANNAKSLIFSTLKKALGDFAADVDVGLLIRQQRKSPGAPRPELARFRYLRMAIMREADSHEFFDSGALKDFSSGGDELDLRQLHSPKYFSFAQTHTPFIHTNQLPRLSSHDPGVIARLRVIGFYAQFLQDVEDDPEELIFRALDRVEMEAAFEAEMSGILAWIVQGAGKALANGRRLPPPPPCVIQATDDYKVEHDLVGQFLEVHTQKSRDAEARFTPVYKAFKTWCQERLSIEAKSVMGPQKFSREMSSHVEKKRDKFGEKFLGIRLLPGPMSDDGAASPSASSSAAPEIDPRAEADLFFK